MAGKVVLKQHLNYKKLSANAKTPTIGSDHAAGIDLYAAEECVLSVGERKAVPTDLAFAIPYGSYGRIAPISGMALRAGLDVMAGVIDSDYRGNVKVVLINLGQQEIYLRKHDRMAQLILTRYTPVDVLQECDRLSGTRRGKRGFGEMDSTGKFKHVYNAHNLLSFFTSQKAAKALTMSFSKPTIYKGNYHASVRACVRIMLHCTFVRTTCQLISWCRNHPGHASVLINRCEFDWHIPQVTKGQVPLWQQWVYYDPSFPSAFEMAKAIVLSCDRDLQDPSVVCGLGAQAYQPNSFLRKLAAMMDEPGSYSKVTWKTSPYESAVNFVRWLGGWKIDFMSVTVLMSSLLGRPKDMAGACKRALLFDLTDLTAKEQSAFVEQMEYFIGRVLRRIDVEIGHIDLTGTGADPKKWIKFLLDNDMTQMMVGSLIWHKVTVPDRYTQFEQDEIKDIIDNGGYTIKVESFGEGDPTGRLGKLDYFYADNISSTPVLDPLMWMVFYHYVFCMTTPTMLRQILRNPGKCYKNDIPAGVSQS